MSRIRTVVATEILLVLGLLAFVAGAHVVEHIFDLRDSIDLSPLGALVMSAVPGLLWLTYFYIQDRHEPEPTHYVLGVYLLGCFVAGPMSEFLTDVLLTPVPLATRSLDLFAADRLVRAFLLVALAQEFCKYVVVRYTIYRSPEFDEPMDGVVYMTAAGVGFATWDNYLAFRTLEGNVFLSVGAADAVITTLAHACFAGIMGYVLGRARFSARSDTRRSLTLFIGLAIAAALSGQFHLVESAVSQAGMDVAPWRGLAYAAGFAAACFFVISLLMRRLLAISPFRPPDGRPDGESDGLVHGSGDSGRLDGEEQAPAFWQRHALLVVIAALALLAVGRLAHRSLTTPEAMAFEHLGLRFERPSGWLPPVEVGPAPERFFIAGPSPRDPSGATASRSSLPYHVSIPSPHRARLRVEVIIRRRPVCGNLAMAMAVERRVRAGETYRAFPSQSVEIAGETWLRTRFELVPSSDTPTTPPSDTGIEYAIARASRLYRVTVYGDGADARELDEMIRPTLRVSGSEQHEMTGVAGTGEQRPRPRWPRSSMDTFHDATPYGMSGRSARSAANGPEAAVVVVVALDHVAGRLEAMSAGSGVVVTGDGAVLTAFHVLHDAVSDRLHDLVVIGRPGRFPGEPELICAGYPESGQHDRDRDLAIVRCAVDLTGRGLVASEWPAIPVAAGQELESGSAVRILGYPGQGNGHLVVTRGTVTGWTGPDGQPGRTFARTDASIDPGVSGGPVIDDRDQLIGIAAGFRHRTRVATATGQHTEINPVGLFRPIESASGLLAAARTSGVRSTWSETERRDPLRDLPPTSISDGVTVLSRVVDAANDRPITGALVIVFQPGTAADSLDRGDLDEHVLTWGRSDSRGDFVLSEEIPRGSVYSVAVLADGYRPLDGRGALVLHADAPEFLDPWGVIRLARE